MASPSAAGKEAGEDVVEEEAGEEEENEEEVGEEETTTSSSSPESSGEPEEEEWVLVMFNDDVQIRCKLDIGTTVEQIILIATTAYFDPDPPPLHPGRYWLHNSANEPLDWRWTRADYNFDEGDILGIWQIDSDAEDNKGFEVD